MPPSSDVVFVAKGLTKVYRMGDVEVHALRGVDVEIHAGELIVLLGPSGSGKSTLLNIPGGLDFASGGTALSAITISRRPASGHSPAIGSSTWASSSSSTI